MSEEQGPSDTLPEALAATLAQASKSALYAERIGNANVRTLADFRKLPLTTREDLTGAGVHGTRAMPLERVCHYGETSGTSGNPPNSTWLTTEDFASNARAIARRHPAASGYRAAPLIQPLRTAVRHGLRRRRAENSGGPGRSSRQLLGM